MRFYSFMMVCIVLLMGCGADEVPEPGEEVVSDTWIEPENIGKTYTLEWTEFGDTITLHTGESLTYGEFNFIHETKNGWLVTSSDYITLKYVF